MPDGSGWDESVEPVDEPIERRRRPRGIVSGLALIVPAGSEQRLDAIEASAHGFFARDDDPERFRLGDQYEIEVSRAAVRFFCRVEVVRKEIAPRRGVAFRIIRIAASAQAALDGLVGDA